MAIDADAAHDGVAGPFTMTPDQFRRSIGQTSTERRHVEAAWALIRDLAPA